MLGNETRLAALNLVRQRRRTMISLAAIVVGVVGYLLASGFIEWIFWATREAAIQTGLGHIQISARGFRARGTADPYAYLLPPNTALRDRIAKLPGVEDVGARLLVSGLISAGDVSVPFAGEGIEPAHEENVSKVVQIEGSGLRADDSDAVVLGKGLARTLHVHAGDRVVFLVNGPNGGVRGAEAVVRGVVSIQVRAWDDLAVRMPLAMAQQLLGTKGAHLWVVSLKDTLLTTRVQAALVPLLGQAGLEQRSWLELSDFYRKTVDLLSRQMQVVTALIGVILVLSIANLLTMSILERTGEIGTMLALGTPRGAVLRMHVAEGVLLGAAGAAAGAVVGILLASVISIVGIPMPPPPGRDSGYTAHILVTAPIVVTGVVMALASAVCAALYPAWKASRMPIVDALRYNR